MSAPAREVSICEANLMRKHIPVQFIQTLIYSVYSDIDGIWPTYQILVLPAIDRGPDEGKVFDALRRGRVRDVDGDFDVVADGAGFALEGAGHGLIGGLREEKFKWQFMVAAR